MIGWDIGGVNTKVARVSRGAVCAVRSRPFEVQRDPAALTPLLRELALEAGMLGGEAHGVTMTAELSQMFRTKREGVGFVLDAVEAAFPASVVSVYGVDGRFRSVDEARNEPLAVAAANWAATAQMVARTHRDAILIDIGSTSSDIIPISAGEVVAQGSTDPDRLLSGELVYTGALRTAVEAIATDVPFAGGRAALSAEAFALSGDVHVWRGRIDPADYTCPTPDGRPPTREYAGERLARAICADREMLDAHGVDAIADALATAQAARVVTALRRVSARHPAIRTAIVAGLGAFIAEAAAREVGLRVVDLAEALGDAAARCAPAAAVALLLEESLRAIDDQPRRLTPPLSDYARRAEASPSAVSASAVDVVVKIGGGLLAVEGCLDAVLPIVAEVARVHRVLIVPGGGPFADTVRHQDNRLRLSDGAAHWMAVLAMDQYAHLIASRFPRAILVSGPDEIAAVTGAGGVPILESSRWLRRVDPLPHSWEVTSDSIAAWVAGQVGARSLVLIKPPGAHERDLTDPYFQQALPPDVVATSVTADRAEALRAALSGLPRDGRLR